MPRIPTYDNFQSQVAGQPNALFQAPSGPNAGSIAAEQTGQMGAAMGKTGDAMGKVAMEAIQAANEDVVNNQAVELSKIRTNLKIEAMSLTGRAALERPDNQSLQDEFQEKFKKAAGELSAGLKNPDQQRLFNRHVASSQESLGNTIGEHVVQQSKQFRLDGQAARLEEFQRTAGLLPFDSQERANSMAGIDGVLAEIKKDNGWDDGRDKSLIDAARTKMLAPMHAGVIKGMISAGKPEDAEAYYKDHSSEMTLQTKVTMQEAVQTAVTAGAAQVKGAELASKYDYLHTGDAQKEIDAMDAPPSQKAAIRAELEHRHAIAQSDSDKSNAMLVGKLDEFVQRGMSISDIQKTTEFQSVRDKGAVLKMARDKSYMDLLRANANDVRSLSLLQREEARIHIAGAAEAFKYMDPQVLASTPREKIEGLLPTLGRQWTETLLNRKDSIVKTGPQDATVDHEDMIAVMQEMGLKPLEKNKSESGKADLAITQSRIERALTERQSGGIKLSREQKNEIMRTEVARRVTVYGWPNTDKSVVDVTPEDLPKVIIPPEHLSTQTMPDGTKVPGIQDEMAELYKLSNGKDPQYAPTKSNLAAFYLAHRKGSTTSKYITRVPDAK